MGEWEHAPEFPPRLVPQGGLQSSEGTGHQVIAEAEAIEQWGHRLGRADGFGPRGPGSEPQSPGGTGSYGCCPRPPTIPGTHLRSARLSFHLDLKFRKTP